MYIYEFRSAARSLRATLYFTNDRLWSYSAKRKGTASGSGRILFVEQITSSEGDFQRKRLVIWWHMKRSV
jgi:hypothetical protein